MTNRVGSIAVCGIYCGACPHFQGRIRESAMSLRDWLDGWNFGDVAQFILPPGMNYPGFREVLSAIANHDPCGGCREQANPLCPIKLCAKGRNAATCAECDRFVGDINKPCNNEEPLEIFRLISRRYSGWNLENLKRIREVGVEKFIDEMEQKISKGFNACEVISKEKVFSR